MSFDAQAVFSEGSFWGFSMVYWFIIISLTPMIAQAINETA
jgi:hypothetical protein